MVVCVCGGGGGGGGESKSKKKKVCGSRWVVVCVWGGGGGGVDGRTDEQAKSNFFFEVGGITMHKCTSYGPHKLNL